MARRLPPSRGWAGADAAMARASARSIRRASPAVQVVVPEQVQGAVRDQMREVRRRPPAGRRRLPPHHAEGERDVAEVPGPPPGKLSTLVGLSCPRCPPFRRRNARSSASSTVIAAGGAAAARRGPRSAARAARRASASARGQHPAPGRFLRRPPRPPPARLRPSRIPAAAGATGPRRRRCGLLPGSILSFFPASRRRSCRRPPAPGASAAGAASARCAGAARLRRHRGRRRRRSAPPAGGAPRPARRSGRRRCPARRPASPAPRARPLRCPAGRSTWVGSPVTTMRVPSPMRVRNIFICAGVVFCASSRMAKQCARVRPRMKASGAISISPEAMRRATCSAGSMSCSAS